MRFIVILVLVSGLILTALLLIKARMEGSDHDDGPGKRR